MRRLILKLALLLACVVGLPGTVSATTFISHLPEEVRKQVIELHKLLGRDLEDPDDETPLRLPRDEMPRRKAMDLLLACIDSKSSSVRGYSLCLASGLITTPEVYPDEVATLLVKILEHREDKDDSVRKTVTSILWKFKVAGMSEEAKLAYCKAYLLERRTLDFDVKAYVGAHRDTILDILAEMATPEAVEVLKEAGGRKDLSIEEMAIQGALLKAEFVRAEDKLVVARKILALRDKTRDARETYHLYGVQTWAIRRMGRTKGVDEKALVAFLKEVFDDRGLNTGVCREAGLALRRRGVKVDMTPPRFPPP